MKVLTSDAVQDPTKVEARVRREVAMRKLNHDKMNEQRKLTSEQRREKTDAKKLEEEKKGLFGAVYKYVSTPIQSGGKQIYEFTYFLRHRISNLSDPAHRFKVRKNAEQMGLTGITVFNPHFSLVVIEGSSKAIKVYNRLMLVRIQWTEAAAARSTAVGDEDELDEEAPEGEEPIAQGNNNNTIEAPVIDSEVSLADNRCDKIWEGPLRDRAFKLFKARSCPTDTLAKDALGTKWIGQWDLAKNFVPEEEL